MKALYVQINSHKHCLAGVPNGGVEVSIGPTQEKADSPYLVSVYGVDANTKQVALWPSARVSVGDEIKIVVVEVDDADPPDH
jgi:hypothetical protein